MCTSVYLDSGYFGRTLDYERSFGEEVLRSPRGSYCFGEARNRYACLGVGVFDGRNPMYFDGINEFGLCAAALNFSGYADYSHGSEGLTSGKLVSFVLGFCRSTDEAKSAIEKLGIVGGEDSTPLHWMIADKDGSIVVEQTKSGMKVYDNHVGVMTNNPPFPYHLKNLENYLNLSAETPVNRFAPDLDLKPYSRGMGGIGIPGDISSMSRFVRASFVKLNSIYGNTEKEAVNQFFHVLYSVYQQKGCAQVNDMYEVTNYVPTRCIFTKTRHWQIVKWGDYKIEKSKYHGGI